MPASATTASASSWRSADPPMALSRRDLLKATAALAAMGAGGLAAAASVAGDSTLPASATAGTDASGIGPLLLWFRRPATQWVEALPLGNGRLGAMVWGGGKHERIQLNEDTLYAGGPYNPNPSGALAALPTVRELLLRRSLCRGRSAGQRQHDGEPEQADAVPAAGRPGAGFPGDHRDQRLSARTGPVHRCGDVDLRSARTPASDAKFSCRRRTRSSRCACRATSPGVSRCGSASTPTSLMPRWKPMERPACCCRDTTSAAFGIDGALRFALRLSVLPQGGTLRQLGDRIEVRDADEVVLLLTAATSHRNYHDVVRQSRRRSPARNWTRPQASRGRRCWRRTWLHTANCSRTEWRSTSARATRPCRAAHR